MSDAELLAPQAPPFTPLHTFVITLEITLSNFQGRTTSEVMPLLAPHGAVVALNTNYAHRCQPGFERFLKAPRPRPREGARPRTLQGDGTCFNSAIEATISPTRAHPGVERPAAVDELLRARAADGKADDKYYELKAFPASGISQVPGVLVDQSMADGLYIARVWAKFLTDSRAGTDSPDAPVAVLSERPRMVNSKFCLVRTSERIILNLRRISDSLLTPRPFGVVPPWPIVMVKAPQDNQSISFKFQILEGDARPPAARAKALKDQVRVNIFARGKVNFLGAPDFTFGPRAYAFMAALLQAGWASIVQIQPLTDRERAAAAAAEAAAAEAAEAAGPEDGAAAAAAAEAAAAADAAEAFAGVSVADLWDMLGGGPPAAPAPAPFAGVSAADLWDALGYAEGGQKGAAGSDDLGVDEVQGEDVEEDEADALHEDAGRGGRTPGHAPPDVRDDVGREDVAHDEQEHEEQGGDGAEGD